MYRFNANSRATISSTAIFFSQQSRQYRSSPRGSETSLAPQSAHFDFARADFRAIQAILDHEDTKSEQPVRVVCALTWRGYFASGCESAGRYIVRTYSLTIRRALNRGRTVRMDCLT